MFHFICLFNELGNTQLISQKYITYRSSTVNAFQVNVISRSIHCSQECFNCGVHMAQVGDNGNLTVYSSTKNI